MNPDNHTLGWFLKTCKENNKIQQMDILLTKENVSKEFNLLNSLLKFSYVFSKYQ